MNPTIAVLTLRGLLGRRRAVLLVLLPLILVVLAAVLAATGNDTLDVSTNMLRHYGLAVLLPLVTLIVGTGVIGPEIDEGQIMYVLTKPLSRASVIATKYVCAVAVSAVATAVPVWAAGALTFGAGSDVPWAFAVGMVQGSVVYCALFLAIAVLSRNAVTVGLIYALVWESMVGDFIAGSHDLSIQSWSLSTIDNLTSASTITGGGSVVRPLIFAAVTTVVALYLAAYRLRNLTLATAE